MSGLFGGAHKATTHATRAMGIDFQGAQYGPPVPVVYGQNKVAGNCIWYGDFQSQSHQQKAGKGGGGGSTTNYTYSASAQMGLCEGPGISLVTVYDGTSVVNLGSINYSFSSGAKGQAPWSHLSGSYALGYSLTAIFSFQNLALGSSASLPNYNYEVKALKPFSGSIPDANPSDILTDITSDPYHGINFPYLGSLTQYSNYCVANGLFLSPVYDQQQSAQQALSDLFKYTNSYAYYSDDQLKVVPLGDVAVTGNGVTYTPNVTPVVDLDDTDFLVSGNGDTPVQVSRVAPQDALNLVRVEFKDRSNTYHDSAVVGSIDFDVVANGERSDTSETPNGITTGSVARFVAQNLVQRAFYIRNTYTFKLPWNYCYLEPTDIVTITDASLGLTKFPVRITSIEEDGGSVLTVEAEEFPEGVGHSSIYGTQANGGTNPDQNVDPGAVNAPYLFRGPGFLVSNNQPEIWCAVNGSNPMWAACDVYLSHDGTSYTYAGTVASQARYGSVNAALAAGSADPDITNTPTVTLYAPAQLLGGSQADADNFVTLAMIDTEVIAYETATLAGTNQYTLSYLRRGGYGSANVAHNAGAPFVRLDDSIFRIPVDPSLIGQTVYLKFLSLNAFGRTPRTLAGETAYTYVIGSNVELPDVPAVPSSFAVTPVADGVEITWTNSNPAATGCTSVEYATASTGPWTVLAQVGPTTTAHHHGFTSGATYYYRARARGPLVSSGWSAYTSTLNSAGKTVANGATVGAINGPGGNITGAVDTGGYTLIDLNSAHLHKTLDNIGDGATYVRYLGSDATGNRLDFSKGLLNKHLGNIPDDATSSRYAVANIDGNRRALVDFSQGGHLGKNLDNIAWGGTFVSSTQQSSTSGAQHVDNATFQLPTLAGWSAVNATTQFTTASPSPAVGAQFVTITPTAASSGIGSLRQYACNPGDAVSVGGLVYASTGTVASVAAAFYNSTGGFVGQSLASSNATGAWQPVSASGVVPTGAVYMKLFAVGSVANINVGVNYVWCSINDVRQPNAGKAYINFGDSIAGGHVGKHLGNIPDDLTSNRYAINNGAGLKGVSSVDPNKLALIDFTQAGHTGKIIDNIGDGTTYARLLASQTTNGQHKLEISGSGHQIGDQRANVATNAAGPVSRWVGLSVSYTAAAGTPATATISVSAANLAGILPNANWISYNASSASVTGTGGTNVTYYLYYNDPLMAGGTQTLGATTNGNNIYQLNAVYVGSVTVAFPSSGTGSGGGTQGLGGGGAGGGWKP